MIGLPRFLLPTALFALGAVASAQEGPPTPRRPPVLIDRVVATVGDAVILQSTLDSAASARLQEEQLRLERALNPQEHAIVTRRVLQRLVDQHCLAQAAKTLGVLSPSQVEQIFQQQLRRAEQEQVQQLGSYSRFSEELQKQNRSYRSFENEKRLSELSQLTEQIAIFSRGSATARNLLVTPKMMREFYRRERRLFVYGPQADLATVAFPARSSRAVVMEKAREAAALWRQEDLTSVELQEHFPDHARATGDELGISDDREQPLRADFRDFALKNETGTVSDPIEDGDLIWVLKVLDHRDGAEHGFDDPDVQARIRQELERVVRDRLLEQTIRRSYARTHIWPKELDIR